MKRHPSKKEVWNALTRDYGSVVELKTIWGGCVVIPLKVNYIDLTFTVKKENKHDSN